VKKIFLSAGFAATALTLPIMSFAAIPTTTYECMSQSFDLKIETAAGRVEKDAFADVRMARKAGIRIELTDNRPGATFEVYDTYAGGPGLLGLHWTYQVVQAGSMENDLVAIHIGEPDRSTPVNLLRVRFFLKDDRGNPVISYALIEDSVLQTGTCALPGAQK
jgi:hypothetical protein